jgi:hypothetical protein
VGCGKLFKHCAGNVVGGIISITPSFLTEVGCSLDLLRPRERTIESRRGKNEIMLGESDKGQREKFPVELSI